MFALTKLIAAVVIGLVATGACASGLDVYLELYIAARGPGTFSDPKNIPAMLDRDAQYLILGRPTSGPNGDRAEIIVVRAADPQSPPMMLPTAPAVMPFAPIITDVDQGAFAYRCPNGGVSRVLIEGAAVENWPVETITLPPNYSFATEPGISPDGSVYMIGFERPSFTPVLLHAAPGTLQFTVSPLPFAAPGLGYLVREFVLGRREVSPGVFRDYAVANFFGFEGNTVVCFDVGATTGIWVVMSGPFSDTGAQGLATAEWNVFAVNNDGSAPVVNQIVVNGALPAQPIEIVIGPVGTVINRLRAFLICGILNFFYSPEQIVGNLRERTGDPELTEVWVWTRGESVPLESTSPGATVQGRVINELGWVYSAVTPRGDLAFVASHPDDTIFAYLTRGLFRSCPGDADGSLRVDFADIAAALSAFGSNNDPFPCPPGIGDANFDGVVTFLDIATTLSSFGDDCR